MSDIIGHNEPLKKIICNLCKHVILGTFSCDAFNDIPNEITSGKNNHSKPLKGQKNNIVFEPKK